MMSRSALAWCAVLALPLTACSDDNSGDSDTGPADVGADVSTDTGADTGEDATPSTPTLSFVEVPLAGDRGIVTELRFLPGDSNEFVLLEKDGVVAHYAMTENGGELLGQFDMPGVYTTLDCGLISMAFDPDFETNQYAYVGMCTSGEASGVYRLRFDPSDYNSIPDSVTEILSLEEPAATQPWHNVGAIGFDDTGAMWALFGDKTVRENGQDASNALGSMVRIIPNREEGGSGYTIPEDNPFVGDAERADEIYAYGLRSPWRGLRDHAGRYWIGDVGADSWEELNVVTEPGQNFGWATHEGECTSNCGDTVNPVAAYPHTDEWPYIFDDPEAEPVVPRNIWVGVEYQDRGNDPYGGALTNRVLFGGFCLGFVRMVTMDDDDTLIEDVHVGHIAHTTGWDQSSDGHIYAVTFGACETIDLDPPPTSRLYRVELEQ